MKRNCKFGLITTSSLLSLVLSLVAVGCGGLLNSKSDSSVKKVEDEAHRYTEGWFLSPRKRMSVDSRSQYINEQKGTGNFVKLEVYVPDSRDGNRGFVDAWAVPKGKLIVQGSKQVPDWFNVGYMCLPRVARDIPGFNESDLVKLANLLAKSANTAETDLTWLGRSRTAYWLTQLNRTPGLPASDLNFKSITSNKMLIQDDNCQYMAVFSKAGFYSGNHTNDFTPSKSGIESIQQVAGLCWYGNPTFDGGYKKGNFYCASDVLVN